MLSLEELGPCFKPLHDVALQCRGTTQDPGQSLFNPFRGVALQCCGTTRFRLIVMPGFDLPME